MRVFSVLFAVVALVLIISLLCIWFYPLASVQEIMANDATWDGIRRFYDEFGASSIDSLDDLPDLPEKAILVTIPYFEYTTDEMSKIKQFVEDGGTLLFMDDYGYGNTVLAYFGVDIRFSHKPLLDPLYYYKNQRLPRIIDFAPEAKESGIDLIILNHATALTNVTRQEAIAWSSSSSFLDINENDSWERGEPKGPFAIAAEFRLGEGIVTITSDPSILINSMMDRNNNYSFIRYLTRHKDEGKNILIDSSHLTMAPLNASKKKLADARRILSSPYALLGIIAMLFVVVSRYTLRKGEIIG